jgi:uncharacterized membrane protein
MVSISGALILLVALIILWVVVSIPVYISARIITSGRQHKASFGSAMAATLGGSIVYFIVLSLAYLFLSALIGHDAVIVALILAIIAWLAVYKAAFDVGWLGALGIAILAAIVLFVLNVILAALFGIAIPSFFNPL